MTCEPGRVLVVDAENGRAEIHRRVHTLALPADGMHCFEADGFDLRHGTFRFGFNPTASPVGPGESTTDAAGLTPPNPYRERQPGSAVPLAVLLSQPY